VARADVSRPHWLSFASEQQPETVKLTGTEIIRPLHEALPQLTDGGVAGAPALPGVPARPLGAPPLFPAPARAPAPPLPA